MNKGILALSVLFVLALCVEAWAPPPGGVGVGPPAWKHTGTLLEPVDPAVGISAKNIPSFPTTACANGESYVYSTTAGGMVCDTPAGGGDMVQATWDSEFDADDDGNIDVPAGGTDRSSWTQYAILYASHGTTLSEIPIGADGKYLKSLGATAYTWDTPSGSSDSFKTLDVENGTDPVADSATDTLKIYDGPGVTVTGSATADSITVAFSGSFSDVSGSVTDAQVPDDVTISTSALSGDVTSAQIAADMARDSELFGGNFSDLAGSATDAQVPDDITITAEADSFNATGVTADWVLASDGSNGTKWKADSTGAGGGNVFATFDVDNGTDPVADSSTDTLLLYSGTGITVTGNATADSITIAFSGSFSDVSGSATDAQVPDDITVEATSISGSITSAQIAADMARDSELFGGNFSDLAGSATDAQIPDDITKSGGTDIAVADGGTGASTASGARSALEIDSPFQAAVITGTAITPTTYPLYKAPTAITITDIHCITDTGTVVIELYEGTATAFDGGTTVDAAITCDSNGAEDDGTLTNGTIDANDWIAARIGTEASSPTMVGITFYYTVD